MSAHHKPQFRTLYGPNLGTQTDNLIPMGDSLKTAADELARDCTLPRIDAMLARLKTAENTLVRIRLALAAEEKTGWGTG